MYMYMCLVCSGEHKWAWRSIQSSSWPTIKLLINSASCSSFYKAGGGRGVQKTCALKKEVRSCFRKYDSQKYPILASNQCAINKSWLMNKLHVIYKLNQIQTLWTIHSIACGLFILLWTEQVQQEITFLTTKFGFKMLEIWYYVNYVSESHLVINDFIALKFAELWCACFASK